MACPPPVFPPNEPDGDPTERSLPSSTTTGDPAVQLSLPFLPCTSVGDPAVQLSLPFHPCTSVGAPTVPHPAQPPPPLFLLCTRGLRPPGMRQT